MIDPKGLQDILAHGRRALIVLHDNPDPDAIAAGWLLEQIAKSLGLDTAILYGGNLGRAENRAMVKLLDIPLARLDSEELRPRKTDRYLLVDTQPGAGNNSFPDRLCAHVVIDHHPPRSDLAASFVDVRTEDGCTTTLLLGYHQAFALDLSPALATAAYYAIISETQDLDREASKADLSACQKLLPMVRLTMLGKIRHPARERSYFQTIARAMQQVMVGKNTCISHIGPVPNAELVAEVADFLVAMKQVTWCLVSGLYGQAAVISIRTTRPEGKADQMMQEMLEGIGEGGGHEMMAGGSAPCNDVEQYRSVSETISERFLARLPRRAPENLHPLLEGYAEKVEEAEVGPDDEEGC